MINLKELRLGSIIKNTKGVCIVNGLLKDMIGYGQSIWGSEESFEPIPLTQKIFLDSGFKHTMGASIVIFEKDLFSVEIHIIAEDCANFRFFIGGKPIPCKSTIYVHNLQNAYFMATGEELQIVIK